MLHRLVPFALCLLLLPGCKKESDAPYTPSSPGGTSTPTFDMTVNGFYGVRMTLGGSTMLTLVESDSLGVYAQANGQENVPPTPSTRYYTAAIQNVDLVQDRFRLTIGTLEYQDVTVLPSELYAFLAPGPRTYGPATTGSDGVELAYIDMTGQEWTTRCAGGGQPTSTFTITDILEGYDKLGPKATIAATFTCTLYNCGTGATLPVTNGGLVFELREF